MRGQSTIYLDASWERDLAHHTYLAEHITVLCPVIVAESVPPSHVPFTDPRFEFVGLPAHAGTLRYIVSGRVVRAIARIWRAVGRADVMFAGLVEHPLPLGWFAFPIAKLRKVVSYTFVESAPWRPVRFVPSSSWRFRIRSAVWTWINTRMLRLVDFAAISQPAYGELLRPTTPRVLTPASWFLHDEMAPSSALDERLAATASRPPGDPPVVLFVGRLDPAKGVRQLLDALRRIDADGFGPITIKILGGGQLEHEVTEAASYLTTVRVEMLEPVPYGPEFFGVFDGVDCLVVPSLSDEQPRIVFDAASQGVAVFGFETPGLASVVEDGDTGVLVPTGSVAALATALGSLRRPDVRKRCIEMGRRAWLAAGRYDHVEMHRRRAAFIDELFAGPSSATVGNDDSRVGNG